MIGKNVIAGIDRKLIMWCLPFIVSCHLCAEETINWVKLDFPPFEINSAPFKDQGIVDFIRKDIQSALPQYRHRESGLMNQERIIRSFEQGNLCHSALIRTSEIESATYMSIGVGIMPTHAIITRLDSNKRQLNLPDTVSLLTLLSNPKLVLVVPTRTLGATIDTIIDQHKTQKNLYFRRATEIHGLFDMLFKERIDYTIGFPAEVIYWNQQHPDKQLKAITIEEVTEKYTIGRVACSKTAWGKHVIADINQALLKIRLDEKYITENFLPWIPQQFHQEFIDDFHQIISADAWTNIEPEVLPVAESRPIQ